MMMELRWRIWSSIKRLQMHTTVNTRFDTFFAIQSQHSSSLHAFAWSTHSLVAPLISTSLANMKRQKPKPHRDKRWVHLFSPIDDAWTWWTASTYTWSELPLKIQHEELRTQEYFFIPVHKKRALDTAYVWHNFPQVGSFNFHYFHVFS
jgi:hypothetical protein